MAARPSFLFREQILTLSNFLMQLVEKNTRCYEQWNGKLGSVLKSQCLACHQTCFLTSLFFDFSLFFFSLIS